MDQLTTVEIVWNLEKTISDINIWIFRKKLNFQKLGVYFTVHISRKRCHLDGATGSVPDPNP